MLAKEHREMMAGGTAQIPPCPSSSHHRGKHPSAVSLEGLVCACAGVRVQVCTKGSEHQQPEKGCDLSGLYA